jgi:hypothetical protein
VRIILTYMFSVIFCLAISAQQKDFEGIIHYKGELRSKSEVISDKALKAMVAFGNEKTVYFKHGDYKQVSGPYTIYDITKDQRRYYKFNSLDTLYYADYTSDTSILTDISKSEEKRSIAGYECKSITIKSSDATRKYFYAPALYMNPEYDKNDKIGGFDAYTKETSSLYLEITIDNKVYTQKESCTHVQRTEVADSVFKLPVLPLKKYVIEELITPPEFTRTGGWTKYLETSIDKELGLRYINIPKGEEVVSQTVYVKFLVNEYGRVSNAFVENEKEVHRKLADEALRVVNASPPWKPAIAYGSEKTIYWCRVPITFQVSKK